jgi:hypothetical protein
MPENGRWDLIRRLKFNSFKISSLHQQSTVRAIRRRIKLAGHVARMGREEVNTRFDGGNLKEEDHLENIGLDGKIIIKCIL